MRDVSAKVETLRTATARAVLTVSPATMALIREGRAPKGDPLPVAKVAAIQAAKNTPQLIPYCHSVPLDYVGVEFELGEDSITATVEVKAIYKTGVEMEALTAVAAAALNLYDMLKIVDDAMEIRGVTLLSKTGGKSNVTIEGGFTARVIVVSDSAAGGRREDRSGALLREGLAANGGDVPEPAIVADDERAIRQAVLDACEDQPDFVFTTGGTGLGPRDVTPEAVGPLIEHPLPGIEDALRAYSRRRVPVAMLSRLRAGRRGKTVIVCLPGSPGAARDAIGALFPYIRHAPHVIEGGGHGG
jgi:molybdenum cofactor biosynthesis protein MoaC